MSIVFLSGWSFSSSYLCECLKNNFDSEIQFIDTTNILKLYDHKHKDSINKVFNEFNLKLRNQNISTLIGWSLGGVLAQIIASKNLYNLEKLILINTTSDFIAEDNQRKDSFEKLLQGISINRKEILKRFYSSLLREPATWEFIKPSSEDLVNQSSNYDNLELINSLNFLCNTKLYEELKNIDVSTKILTSTNDKLIPTEHSQILNSRIKNSELIVLKQHSHLLPIQVNFMKTLSNAK